MYKNNSRNSNKIDVCSLLLLCHKLKDLIHEFGYYSYTPVKENSHLLKCGFKLIIIVLKNRHNKQLLAKQEEKQEERGSCQPLNDRKNAIR